VCVCVCVYQELNFVYVDAMQYGRRSREDPFLRRTQ